MTNSSNPPTLKEAIIEVMELDQTLDEIIIYNTSTDETHLIQEGKWIKTTTSNKIRIDKPTHGAGQTHAHIYGRKGKEMGVVNLDGTASHGKPMTLPKKDAETLTAHGFNIRSDHKVEWIISPELTYKLLLG